MTSVAIIKGRDPSEMISTALRRLGADQLINSKDKVLIKPNYVVARDPSTGVTTDSKVVESLIEFAKDVGVKEIVVGEGGAGSTNRAFDTVGIREVTARQKVRLIDLNQEPRISVKIPEHLALKEVGIAKIALESMCIINVPTLKVHHLALVTLCMKNLMGLILPKSIMHSQIDEKIVDLATLFKQKVKINIIDGLIGTEVDECSGRPVRMDLIIAGEDMVAVDTVGTAVMGINPEKVKYLKLAEEKGLGVSDLSEIELLGESIEGVKRRFRLPPEFRDN